MIELREQQMECVEELRSAYAHGAHAPLLVAPTGSGKTVIFSWIAAQSAARGKNVLILVHRKELLQQTADKLRDFGLKPDFIAAGMPMGYAPIQIASVATLARRLDWLEWRPDLIIIDEAHHAVAGTWAKILARYDRAKLLGVTATPERLDGKGLGLDAGGFFDAMILGPSVADQIGRGYLSQPVILAPPYADIERMTAGFEKKNNGELAEQMDRPRITGDAIQHYRKHCPDEPAIAFCVTLDHARNLAAAFSEAGIPAAMIDGKLSPGERKSRIDDLAQGKFHVLTSCEVVSEGIDIPVVSVAILLRPTQSLALHLQQVGRVLRPHPEKSRALILDHVGNSFRHGFPDDDREWSLSGKPNKGRGEKREREFPIRQCEQCYHVHRPAPQCPKCGYVYPIQRPQIDQVDGELKEVERRERRVQQSKARTLAELRELARQRGYKPGWAYHVWQSRKNKFANY